MKFLQFLLIFFAVFYLVRVLFRALLPGLARMMMKKMSYKFTQQYQQQYQQQYRQSEQSAGGKHPREGEIRVEYVPPQTKEKPAASPKVGEFVEFEEVKVKKE